MEIQATKALHRRGIDPILRAYGFGALSFLGPRLLGLIFAKVRQRKGRNKSRANGKTEEKKHTGADILRILRQTLDIHRFPAFCGFTVTARLILQPLFEKLLSADARINPGGNPAATALVSRHGLASFSAGALAAAGGLQLLNARQTGDAGRTLDLTLFALTRAVDIVVGELWERRKDRRVRAGKFNKLDSSIGYVADSLVFAVSTAVIMFAWFYYPEKLPAAYNKQIVNIAKADHRLVETLRQIRNGDFIYGVTTDVPPVLPSYCTDLGLPPAWGDPAQTIPIPCEVVHGGQTKSCELFALRRFWIATWKTAFPLYLGLNMVKFLRPRRPAASALLRALFEAVRSSAFLGSFVGIFWYAICLTRTRIGPRLLKTLDPLAFENLCVKVGCFLCGWSILVETPHRRTEIAFFVAPRALAVLLPRTYNPRHQWIENTVFALSSGVILTVLRHKPQRIRGVFGKLLRKIVTE